MADVEEQLPHLAEHMQQDREWLWYCGPSLQGEHNKETREKLGTRGIGFRFAPGGHPMPDGGTGSWAHCCEHPTRRQRKDKRPAGEEEEVVAASSAPDWAKLGL